VQGKCPLFIIPVNPGWAEEGPGDGVVETPVRLDVAGQRRIQWDVTAGYPFQDDTFQTLGIVRSRAGNAFLNLESNPSAAKR
jgi:hypothetical protein